MFSCGAGRHGISFGILCLAFAFPVLSAVAATPKRVLVVHSFVNAAPPFTTHSTAFEKELTAMMGEPVDLNEVSLDVARYATLDMEEALVDLMRKRQTKWQPDIVVPIGSPAGMFVARHRARIFPETTPIIYAGMDKRRLPEGALAQNATFVGESFEVRGMVEDMLQIAPDTENVVVVIGASPLEQFWADVFRREFQAYEPRLRFTWLNDLSLDGILDRTKNLPPRSFIFMVLMMRDASGVTHDADKVLQQIHATANAPINSIFQHQLGLGIVGGRLYQAEAQGEEAARIAIQILRGEPTSSFPPRIIPPLPPQFDARELKRWNIDEGRLPEGSIVRFREPTFWQRHRALILVTAAVCTAQTVLITVLVANLVRRRRAERSLGQTEERVSLATKAARVGVWELNPASDEVWASEMARELFEFGRDVKVTRPLISSRVHPEDREVREQAIDRAISSRGEYEIEYRILLHRGEIRWIAGRGRWVEGDDEVPGRLIGISMDVTERKEAQELFRVATESSPSGTILVDQHGAIVLANARSAELFGYERDELAGMSVGALFGNEFSPGLVPERRAMADHHEAEAELNLLARKKDGSHFPAQVGLNPVRAPRGDFVLISIQDISSRLRAEEEARRQREQVEVLGRANVLGEMTASLTHELGQPLTAILATASAGLRFMDRGDASDVELREILAAVETDGRRARDIIQNIRNAMKKGAGIRAMVDMNKIVENVSLMLRPDAAVYSCAVQVSLRDDLPSIEADPLQMRQVLINLVTNAFHAQSETPIAQRRVEIITDCGDNAVRVQVRDNGTGLSEQALKHLFEQFYTTKEDGLGMGLAIVRSIIESHGGTITAYNVEGGACFQIDLPVNVASPAA